MVILNQQHPDRTAPGEVRAMSRHIIDQQHYMSKSAEHEECACKECGLGVIAQTKIDAMQHAGKTQKTLFLGCGVGKCSSVFRTIFSTDGDHSYISELERYEGAYDVSLIAELIPKCSGPLWVDEEIDNAIERIMHEMRKPQRESFSANILQASKSATSEDLFDGNLIGDETATIAGLERSK